MTPFLPVPFPNWIRRKRYRAGCYGKWNWGSNHGTRRYPRPGLGKKIGLAIFPTFASSI